MMDGLSAHFFPVFLTGMMLNFEIAGIALALGLALGAMLVLARLQGGVAGACGGLAVAMMRAAPTFVVMFFLLNALPRGGGLSGVAIVAVSLVPYAAAYVADSGVDAVAHLRAGAPLAGLLILPNIARAFFVLVMSSSAGAAIGVAEGISVILHEAEKMPAVGGKMVLFAVGVTCFGVPLQAAFVALQLIQRQLARAALRREAELAGVNATAAE